MLPYCHKIQYYETDKMLITHHSNYIRLMEEARVDFFEQLGLPYHEMEKEGAFSPVVQVSCDYKKPTTHPDVLEIRVRVLACKKFKFTLGYTMTVDDTVVCTGTSTHCFVDENHRPICFTRFPRFYETMCREVEKGE